MLAARLAARLGDIFPGTGFATAVLTVLVLCVVLGGTGLLLYALLSRYAHAALDQHNQIARDRRR